MSRARVAVGSGVLALGVLFGYSPAGAAPNGPEGFGEPTQEQIERSIQVWDPSGHVEALEVESTEGDDTVVNLDSDILFAFGSAELPQSAATRIADLVSDIPQNARVSVTGHTDNIGSDADNLTLSQQRAEAVASAITAARADLVLTVEGRGETEPVASNSSPEGREDNRRVEIRYGG